MAATKGQRIGIWIIAAFMLVGTVGSFLAIILANKNQQTDSANIQALSTKYQADVAAQTKQLSDKYFTTLNQYSSRPAAFDGASVTDIQTEDLIVGTGENITASSTFTAYYIGWNPTGKVFDESISGTSLKAPFAASPGGVIPGWTAGAAGMKVGGIRELTLPSDQAYGTTGSGTDIPPNTPLKFIIMIIPTPEAVPVPQALLNYYQSQSGGR